MYLQVWFQNHRARARRRNKASTGSSDSPSSSPSVLKRAFETSSEPTSNLALPANPNGSPSSLPKMSHSLNNKHITDQALDVSLANGSPDPWHPQCKQPMPSSTPAQQSSPAQQIYVGHTSPSLVLTAFPPTQAMSGFISTHAHNSSVLPILQPTPPMTGFAGWAMPTHPPPSPLLGSISSTAPLVAQAQTSPRLVIAAPQPWQRVGALPVGHTIP